MDNGMKKPEPAIEGVSLAQFAGIIALAASLAFSPAASTATDAEETASTIVADTSEGWDNDAESMVARMMEEWLQEGQGKIFRAKKDLNVVQGTSLVTMKADNKRWSKARSLAFQNAFVQAMADYMFSVRQEISVSTMRNYFEQDIPDSQLEYKEGETPDSYVKRIVLKSAVLVEHTLDQKLAESGVSEGDIRRLTTPVQKRTTLAQSISKTTLTKAMGSAAGLIPVKTFEGVDDEGNSAIGVVAVYSERMRHIADQISKGEVIRPDPGRTRDSIMDQIAHFKKDELPNEFGVRVMWDEQGYPAIVSFGQWGWSPANLSKRKRAQRRKFAMHQAENEARSLLATFINASTRFTDESNVGEDLENAVYLQRGGESEEIEQTEIVDRLVKRASIKTKVPLTGYTPERYWSAPHPLLKEQHLVGVVAYWSPAREDAIRKTIGKEAKHAPPKEISQKQPKKQISGSAQSRDPDLADF